MDIKGRVRSYQLRGTSIVLHDYSNLGGDELFAVIREAHRLVGQRGDNLNLLTNVDGTQATKEAMEELKALARTASPLVRKSAVVGAGGMNKLLLTTLRLLTGRQIRTFDTLEEAEQWLVE